MSAPPVVLVSSAELARRARITFRQLDYWVRVGLLVTAYPAEGSGSARRFHPVEVDVARAVGALRALGVGEGVAANNVGAHLVREVARAVRAGRPSVTVGAQHVVLGRERLTLWTAYPNGRAD